MWWDRGDQKMGEEDEMVSWRGSLGVIDIKRCRFNVHVWGCLSKIKRRSDI
jgi:hypothetical protein